MYAHRGSQRIFRESLEARIFVRNKLERSWQKLSPEAQDIVKDKYEAVQLLLD